jgi:hypothetical protein
MTRILVAWEDRLHTTLDLFVKRRLSARAPAGETRFPEVLFHTSAGNGSFTRYVGSTWDNIRGKSLPTNPGPIDHLVCVVDGDRLHEQLEAVGRPPASTADLAAWLSAAEQAWQDHLQSLCNNAPKTTVHGRILRWSKESLVLAGYDREAAKQHLGLDMQSPTLKEHLARCVPVPASVANASFSSTFRRPLRCLTELDEAQRAPRPSSLIKNAPELDDTLRALVRDDCALVAERVPDIDRLADLMWQLAMPAPPAAAAPLPAVSPPAAPPGKRTKKRSRR